MAMYRCWQSHPLAPPVVEQVPYPANRTSRQHVEVYRKAELFTVVWSSTIVVGERIAREDGWCAVRVSQREHCRKNIGVRWRIDVQRVAPLAMRVRRRQMIMKTADFTLSVS